MTSTKNGRQALDQAARVVMSAPASSKYGAIRQLANIVLDKLPHGLIPSDDIQWGYFHALTDLIEQNMSGMALDTDLTVDRTTAAMVTGRLLRMCSANRGIEK